MLMAELSDLEESYYAKEVFSHLEQDNDFNMVIDHFVYNMTYKDIAKEIHQAHFSGKESYRMQAVIFSIIRCSFL